MEEASVFSSAGKGGEAANFPFGEKKKDIALDVQEEQGLNQQPKPKKEGTYPRSLRLTERGKKAK